MLIFTKITELKGYLSQIRAQNKTVGFVPTMGALHDGHVSLIKYSKNSCDYTICSIFVNPTQFNDKSDLERYPRMPEKDASLLESAYCDVLFMPSVEEMYPGGFLNPSGKIEGSETLVSCKPKMSGLVSDNQSKKFPLAMPRIPFTFQDNKVIFFCAISESKTFSELDC